MWTGGVMEGEPGWVPPGVDVRRANVARVYDYLLGGSHNFLADQDLGRSLAATDPSVRAIARANRDFLGRAVRFLTQAGIGQFLDIGSGIPTQGNVHEVAQQASPDSRVVYANVDPVAIAHSKALLAGNENTAIIDADLRQPEKILAHAATRRLIDFSQPAGRCSSRCCRSSAMPQIPGGSWPRCAMLLPPAVILSWLMPPTRAGRSWRRLPRRSTTAVSPPRRRCARARRSCAFSTASIWSTRTGLRAVVAAGPGRRRVRRPGQVLGSGRCRA